MEISIKEGAIEFGVVETLGVENRLLDIEGRVFLVIIPQFKVIVHFQLKISDNKYRLA